MDDTLDATGRAEAVRHEGLASAPVVLGRYVVLQKLGAGGMGVVYAAYDPDLDRRVALKLVKITDADDDHAADARQRLQREAQLMARVDHPSVITVHDVGTHGDEVFVAMELVDGATLRDWLAREPRSRREILDVFVQAGEGLAAAHAAGLVHRDFKPDNVLVGKDGRVRVTDFGIARAPAGPRADAADGHSNLAGTPAYMAPEQHLGRDPDARSDQFSFCVALYEALYGERPFAPEGALPTKMGIAVAVLQSRVRPAAKGNDVPPWLRRLLLRGLAVDPDARFPDMAGAVAALSSDRVRRRRRRWFAAAALAALALVATAFLREPDRAEVCTGFATKLDGVWDAPQRARVELAFRATRAPSASDAIARVERALDDRAQQWTALRTDVCRGTRLRGDQSEELLDLRTQCLDERLAEMKALVESFATADRRVVEKSVIAVNELSDLQLCTNARYVRQGFRAPRNTTERAQVDALQEQLAHATALEKTGRYKDSLALVVSLEESARKLGYKPLEAEARLRLGGLSSMVGDLHGAERQLLDAAIDAESAGVDQIAARAWIKLADLVGDDLARPGDADVYLRLGDAAIERFGPDPELVMRMGVARGSVLHRQNRLRESLDEFARVVAVGRGLDPPEARLESDARGRFADTLITLGRFEEGLAAAREATAFAEQHFGPRHHHAADAHFVAGNALVALNRFADARGEFEAAAAIRRAIGENEWLARIVDNLAYSEMRLGDDDAAEHHLREALRIDEKVLGPDHPEVGEILVDFGGWLVGHKRYDEALAAYTRADAIAQRDHHARHRAAALAGTGDLHALRGRWQDALVAYQQARDSYGDTDPHAASMAARASLALVQLGRTGDAAALAATARGLAGASSAATELELVDGELAWRDDPAHARELVTHARDELARVHDVRTPLADAWLAAHAH